MDVSAAGPEGLIHSVTGWVNWVYALFLVTWYALAFLEITDPVNRSWLWMAFACIGFGLALAHALFYYIKQSPDVGAQLRDGSVTIDTMVKVRGARTDHVFMVVMLIIYALWFALGLAVYLRTDGKGEAAVDYLIANPAADANITTTDLLVIQRHNNQMMFGLFVSILLLIFGSIAWGIAAQVLAGYLYTQGGIKRGYGGNGDYQLGKGTQGLATQLKGAARV